MKLKIKNTGKTASYAKIFCNEKGYANPKKVLIESCDADSYEKILENLSKENEFQNTNKIIITADCFKGCEFVTFNCTSWNYEGQSLITKLFALPTSNENEFSYNAPYKLHLSKYSHLDIELPANSEVIMEIVLN